MEMIQITVSELKGKALNWAVAMANGRPGTAAMIINTNGKCNYKPDIDPAIAMSIVFDNKIVISPHLKGRWTATGNYFIDVAMVKISYTNFNPLVAAMQVFVRYIFNSDIIEIPSVLINKED